MMREAILEVCMYTSTGKHRNGTWFHKSSLIEINLKKNMKLLASLGDDKHYGNN